MPAAISPVAHLEMAHVLFMDVVGYSKLPMDQQQSVLSHLQHTVRNTPRFVSAQAGEELICLPTGDGMALVFFGDPEAPVRCAVELAHALRYPEIHVRMGVHSGPVYRIADINANRNVAGGGINLAQRVMDCGDAGHILVSAAVAEVLSQLSAWNNCLHDLGEAEVKHGVRVHLFNLYTPEAGNPQPPHVVRSKSARRSLTRPVAWSLAAVVLAITAGTVWRIRSSKVTVDPSSAPPTSAATTPAKTSAPAVQAPAAKPSAAKGTGSSPESRSISPPVKAALKSSPDTPQPSPLTGSFAGPFSLSAGEAQVTVTLEEHGGVITGCMQASGSGLGGGPIRGVASGDHVVATATTQGGRMELQGQAAGNQLRGSFTMFGKSGSKQGSFVLQRRTATATPAGPCPAN